MPISSAARLSSPGPSRARTPRNRTSRSVHSGGGSGTYVCRKCHHGAAGDTKGYMATTASTERGRRTPSTPAGSGHRCSSAGPRGRVRARSHSRDAPRSDRSMPTPHLAHSPAATPARMIRSTPSLSSRRSRGNVMHDDVPGSVHFSIHLGDGQRVAEVHDGPSQAASTCRSVVQHPDATATDAGSTTQGSPQPQRQFANWREEFYTLYYPKSGVDSQWVAVESIDRTHADTPKAAASPLYPITPPAPMNSAVGVPRNKDIPPPLAVQSFNTIRSPEDDATTRDNSPSNERWMSPAGAVSPTPLRDLRLTAGSPVKFALARSPQQTTLQHAAEILGQSVCERTVPTDDQTLSAKVRAATATPQTPLHSPHTVERMPSSQRSLPGKASTPPRQSNAALDSQAGGDTTADIPIPLTVEQSKRAAPASSTTDSESKASLADTQSTSAEQAAAGGADYIDLRGALERLEERKRGAHHHRYAKVSIVTRLPAHTFPGQVTYPVIDQLSPADNTLFSPRMKKCYVDLRGDESKPPAVEYSALPPHGVTGPSPDGRPAPLYIVPPKKKQPATPTSPQEAPHAAPKSRGMLQVAERAPTSSHSPEVGDAGQSVEFFDDDGMHIEFMPVGGRRANGCRYAVGDTLRKPFIQCELIKDNHGQWRVRCDCVSEFRNIPLPRGPEKAARLITDLAKLFAFCGVTHNIELVTNVPSCTSSVQSEGQPVPVPSHPALHPPAPTPAAPPASEPSAEPTPATMKPVTSPTVDPPPIRSPLMDVPRVRSDGKPRGTGPLTPVEVRSEDADGSSYQVSPRTLSPSPAQPVGPLKPALATSGALGGTMSSADTAQPPAVYGIPGTPPHVAPSSPVAPQTVPLGPAAASTRQVSALATASQSHQSMLRQLGDVVVHTLESTQGSVSASFVEGGVGVVQPKSPLVATMSTCDGSGQLVQGQPPEEASKTGADMDALDPAAVRVWSVDSNPGGGDESTQTSTRGGMMQVHCVSAQTTFGQLPQLESTMGDDSQRPSEGSPAESGSRPPRSIRRLHSMDKTQMRKHRADDVDVVQVMQQPLAADTKADLQYKTRLVKHAQAMARYWKGKTLVKRPMQPPEPLVKDLPPEQLDPSELNLRKRALLRNDEQTCAQYETMNAHYAGLLLKHAQQREAMGEMLGDEDSQDTVSSIPSLRGTHAIEESERIRLEADMQRRAIREACFHALYDGTSTRSTAESERDPVLQPTDAPSPTTRLMRAVDIDDPDQTAPIDLGWSFRTAPDARVAEAPVHPLSNTYASSPCMSEGVAISSVAH